MATKAAVTPRTRSAAWPLLVLVLVNVVNFYDRHVPGALAEPIRHEFHLTDAQIGWIGSVFIWLYALVGVPLGRLADTGSRKRLLSAGLALWGLLTGYAAWAKTYALLVFSRLGVGVGEAACAPTATSWIGDLFPPERRARPLALFMLGVPIGGALSFFFSGPIALKFGWRTAMVAAAVPALLLIPAVLLIREPERGASETVSAAAPAGSAWKLLAIPTFWWIVLSGILVNFSLYAVGTFLPAFLGRIHHLNVARAGIFTGVVYAVGGILGGVLGGTWGDRVMARGRADGRMLIAAAGALAAVPFSYFGIRQHMGELAVAIPLLALAYGSLNMYYGLVYASIHDIVAPALRGTAMAVYFLVMYLGGASFSPLLTGELSDAMARRAAALAGSATVNETYRAIGLQQAMLIIPVLSLLLAVVLWAGSKSIVNDSRKKAAISN
ncbi:MAG TPA: MFS transporter [Terriglobales bacterium]|nr:MFS transporter [Terriglobales bacterium]